MKAGSCVRLFSSLALAALLLPAACSQSGPSAGQGGSSGGSSSGGATSSGGVTSSGGTSAAGGSSASGGTTTSGGTTGSGGSTSSGGSQASGGSSAGGSATGGTSTGGSKSGGTTGTGTGGQASGGVTGGGGTTTSSGGATGGKTGSGGITGDGGGPATGGTGGGGSTGTCPTVDFGTWTSGKDPTTVGKLAVENFKPRTSETYGGDGYAWTFGYVGALQFTKTIGDTTNNDFLVSKFNCSQTGPDNGSTASVDTRAFGDLPLEIFLEKGTAACKTLGMARADAQWANTADTAITPDARYWIDDMYMITSLQVWAYRATKNIKYLSRAALTMKSYFTALQQSDGLFWHTKQSKAYWGRANGWVASGMTELLLELPAGADRDAIMAGYKKQMDGLLPHQITSGTSDVGAWRQVIDRTDAKPEMSCTAMFTFALATGVKNGWLTGDKYVTAAANGWKAVANRTDSSGALSQVCPGTGQANAGDLASQQKFYMDIVFQANDRHGQGPELWAANAILRSDCPGVR